MYFDDVPCVDFATITRNLRKSTYGSYEDIQSIKPALDYLDNKARFIQNTKYEYGYIAHDRERPYDGVNVNTTSYSCDSQIIPGQGLPGMHRGTGGRPLDPSAWCPRNTMLSAFYVK